MNWNPDRHEPLDASDWSPERAREALDAIVDEVEAAWRPDGWPPHPRDGMGPSSSQYFGTAGVITGLRYTYERTRREPRLPLAEIARRLQDDLASPHEAHSSLLIGRTGRELVAWRELPGEENAARVLSAIVANDDSTEHELMWGLAGTILASVWMFEVTRDERFANAGRRQVRLLWDAWERSAEGPFTWVQSLYGSRQRYVGAAHGQVGNLHALWSAATVWLDAIDRDELLARTVELASGTAVDGPEGANWPAVIGEGSELVQWCHGAPGVVTALSKVPAGLSDELDALLLRGAELVWNAGPLRKGHILCHGTAGNGFAFLKMWERTSDPIWLERAQVFAMHAIGQRGRIQDEFGRGWFSLWTGDVGLGVYLCACLEPSATWIGWERF